MKELTSRQKAFADYYLELGNATEAARRAGYKGNNLNRVASENLTKLGIKQYIEERQKQIDSKRSATIEEVMRFYTAVMRGKLRTNLNWMQSLRIDWRQGRNL